MVSHLTGKRISLPDQFSGLVTVLSVTTIDTIAILEVQTSDGEHKEAQLDLAEAENLLSTHEETTNTPVNSDSFFLFMESIRIKTAFEYDPHFAVSLSGVRPLPHQLEAVYHRILPQVRLRFLLADDPGAGKTIMAGLLLKELKLRHVIDRILILTPAPLTVQWQDELKSKFAETFEVINSLMVKHQLAGNPWDRFRQCITSIDFAKRDDVLPGILQVDWDLVIIDEAHKCSARTQGDELRRTGRYRLAEELSRNSERILLLTATPHQGDVDQFHNFLRLLDPEQFISNKVNPEVLKLHDSPWFLRRIKEQLKDFQGQKLFKERHAITVPFELSIPEQHLYEAVTDYINTYLGKTKGRKKAAVALTRTVLQRRLASSLHAIYSSLQKRQKRFRELVEELSKLSPEEQRNRLLELGRIPDREQSEEDYTEEDLDSLTIDSTVAEQLDHLREELRALDRLVQKAKQTVDLGEETKLNTLQNCLEKAEFAELQASDGKLLIFTEHRDTLNYLRENLLNWGYSVCEIHGGMNVHARKEAQRDFKHNKQICLATEAAGEGINLQFCRLMINYDLPWNPNRLEQRMGRIHRIGQPQDVYIFNFAAISTVEGRVLEKLLTKLDEIRKAMGDKVFDVVGQLLQQNNIDFEDLIKEATYSNRSDEACETIEQLDPEKLRELEEATGIALATDHVDLSQIQRNQAADYRSEEQRLMPRYVEEFFRRACEYQQINLEVRADGLWRIPYLKEEFRAPQLDAVRRLGSVDKHYPKFSFYKEHLDTKHHSDAEFVSPGHSLFAAIAERLDQELSTTVGYRSAMFIDADTLEPYHIHFFLVTIAGQTIKGKEQDLRQKLCAVAVRGDNDYALVASDCLHDFAPVPEHSPLLSITPTVEEQKRVENWLKVKMQRGMIATEREQRDRELHIRREYLEKAMQTSIRDAKTKQVRLASKVAKGDETYRVARDNAQNQVRSLTERYQTKLKELDYLKIVRPGRVVYLGSALVHPAPVATVGMRNDPDVEAIAMDYVIQYERDRGWEPEDISQLRDGSGFDIRSLGPRDEAGCQAIRRIEVKGRARSHQAVSLTRNEWRKAEQLGESYWLYVVWNCQGDQPELLTIQNPAVVFRGQVREMKEVTRYLLDGDVLSGAIA